MKKSELIQLVTAAKNTINRLRDNLHLLGSLKALKHLESEERLLDKVLSFQKTRSFMEKTDEDEVLFSDFIQLVDFTEFSLKRRDEEQLARICRLWLTDQVNQQFTFMGTEITKIRFKHLVYLDQSYFDISDILSFMKSQQRDGQKIFQNPASTTRQSFSSAAVSILSSHPVTKDFLSAHHDSEEYIYLQRSQLPDRFFDLLHEYLLALHTIGNGDNNFTWGFFDDSSVERCNNARQSFFDKINQEISEEHRFILSKIKIYVPLSRGGTEDVAYGKVVEGRDGYNCVISQQIFLWALLREKRPNTVVPIEISRHSQASTYNLGGNDGLQNGLSINGTSFMIVLNAWRQEAERQRREHAQAVLRTDSNFNPFMESNQAGAMDRVVGALLGLQLAETGARASPIPQSTTLRQNNNSFFSNFNIISITPARSFNNNEDDLSDDEDFRWPL